MKPPVISEMVRQFYTEGAQAFDPRYPAVLFRRTVYVASPRHQDVMNLLYAGMSDHARNRLQDRIAEDKVKIVFGWARGDGKGFEASDCQRARIRMYIEGF